MERVYIFRLKLKEVLEKRGVSQKELSRMTGIREGTISELANDSRSVYNKKHLIKIMDALNIVELSDILELRVIEK